MNVKINKTTGLELNGNVISGNTFPVKDYIKSYLGGKWDSNSKCWIVDVAKVAALLNVSAHFATDETPAQIATTTPPRKQRDGFIVRKGSDGWCNRCQSYCYGDCEANS